MATIPAWVPILRERLGGESVAAICDALEENRSEVVTVVTERFESRLADECSKLRFEMHELRTELRGEMHSMRTELRGEMQQMRADLRVDLANRSSDLTKWTFLFWVGQTATLIALLPLLT